MAEKVFPNQHLKLEDLKRQPGVSNNYLNKNIPEYPKPEFHVSRLKHETSGSALSEIKKDGCSIKLYGSSWIWWSLAVGPDEINDAEKRLREESVSERGTVAPEQQNFLWKFATSPAFKETSRLGSFRFTFPLQEVLTAYSKQICSGADPVMRVLQTKLHKQEVEYAVLVHSPHLNKKFKKHPLLEDDPNAICVYKDGRFIWRSEAMCETHWYEYDKGQMEARRMGNYQFYVWDNVALALHVKKDQDAQTAEQGAEQNDGEVDGASGLQVLQLDFNIPEDFLTYCEEDDVPYRREFQNLDEANEKVKESWPEWEGPLKVERPLQLHYPVTELKLVLTGSSGEETTSTGNAVCGLHSDEMEVDNLVVKIINTPEFSELTSVVDIKNTLDNIRLSSPALHVFLLVIGLQNISADLIRTTVEQFESIFKNKALRRTMILFTHQNQTEPNIQEMMQEVQQFLTEKVDNRYLVFNNSLKDRDPQKVSRLLREAKKILGGD